MRWCFLGLNLVLVWACVPTAARPSWVDYRDALRREDLDAAYALTTADFQKKTSREAFRSGLATPEARRAKLEAVDAALARLDRAAPELALIPRDGVEPKTAAEEAAERFLRAAARGDFAESYRLLSRRWRRRYTPERLAMDFDREPRAKERLERAREALGRGPRARGDRTEFPLAGGGALVLEKEEDGYKVVALE